jgi:hypothetical protein
MAARAGGASGDTTPELQARRAAGWRQRRVLQKFHKKTRIHATTLPRGALGGGRSAAIAPLRFAPATRR